MTDAAELVLYTNPNSRGRIARWMLEEVGHPYRTVVVPYGPEMKTPAFRAINPMGKVPVVTYGGVAVPETAAICMWLADAFPSAGLAPSGEDPLRAAYTRWMFFAAGPFEQSMTLQSLQADYAGEKAGFVGTVPMSEIADILDTLLTGKTWLLGDQFSALDVYLGSQISWSVGFKSLPERDNFGPYIARLKARDAWQRANAADNALAGTQM